jgi:5-deoxy-glucuronate isomerase
MSLHIKSPGTAPGFFPLVERGRALEHLSFAVLQLNGILTAHTLESGNEELAIGSYAGAVHLEAEGAFGRWTANIPPRAGYRDPHPMVYIPAGASVRISAPGGPARLSIAGAQGKPDGHPVITLPHLTDAVGRDNWARTVYTHIGENVDAAHLLVGETVAQPGGWTSCPPHKHDRSTATEIPMEEVYHFHLDPPQGFGMIRVYTDPDDPDAFDEPCVVQDGDTVLIPRGYHPVTVCPGYTLHYAWILAGEGRRYGAWTDDPRHPWIKG